MKTLLDVIFIIFAISFAFAFGLFVGFFVARVKFATEIRKQFENPTFREKLLEDLAIQQGAKIFKEQI